MADPKKLLLSWSSGKDSAWSLHLLLQQPKWKVAGLLTTFNEAFDRVAMHAVRRDPELQRFYRLRDDSQGFPGFHEFPAGNRDESIRIQVLEIFLECLNCVEIVFTQGKCAGGSCGPGPAQLTSKDRIGTAMKQVRIMMTVAVQRLSSVAGTLRPLR